MPVKVGKSSRTSTSRYSDWSVFFSFFTSGFFSTSTLGFSMACDSGFLVFFSGINSKSVFRSVFSRCFSITEQIDSKYSLSLGCTLSVFGF